jgi:thiopeptide-type bacteriocin biosynthesis protein
MPAAHLNVPADQIAAAVGALLAGRELTTAATSLGLDPADLEDAASAYQAAGTLALERADPWSSVRILFNDWQAAEPYMAAVLGPHLDRLEASGALSGWWYLRKHPHWRVRLLNANASAVSSLLDRQVASGGIADWQPVLYEAETAAFGGPAGVGIAHDLFCADSRGTLSYARQQTPAAGRRETSILLISAMTTAAGLDWFERGDVFDRVARLRPQPPAGHEDQLKRLAAQLRVLLTVPPQTALTRPGQPDFTTDWLSAFETAGHRLSVAASDQLLGRGLRAILAHAVLFHWNRLGLSARTQGILARAATSVYLPAE